MSITRNLPCIVAVAVVAFVAFPQASMSRPAVERGPYIARCLDKFAGVNARRKERGDRQYTRKEFDTVCETDYEAYKSFQTPWRP